VENELSAAKRALLQKALQQDRPEGAMHTLARHAAARAEPLPAANWRTPVVAIQSGRSKRPLFYMHVHWQGGAFYCFNLAQMLGPDQPFHILDLYRFDDLPAPPSIETMAADYIAAMRRIQPEGPYQVGAFCGASIIAYEMAQQLRRAGQEVDLLAFIDPMAGPIDSIRWSGALIRRLGRLMRFGSDRQLDWFLRIRYVSRVLRRARDEYTEQADRLMRRWHQEHPRRFRLLPAAGALRQDWLAVFIWAVSAYVPSPYPGKVTYLYAADNPDRRKLWWGTVTQSSDTVEVRVIPGDHVTCRTEHLKDLADALLRCLMETTQARPAPAATQAS